VALSKDEAKELALCARDFGHFAASYGRIVDKHGHLVDLVDPASPRPARDMIWADLAVFLWVFYLKARQLGSSAAIAFWLFWRCLFTPNYKVLVVAHRRTTAEDIFDKFYMTYYAYLPAWMRRLFRVKRSNVRELRFYHGGFIRVTTADSPEALGGTYNAVHLTESSQYEHFEKTVSAILQTAGPDAQIIFETVANGPNETHEFWNGTGHFAQAKHFKRRFLGWMLDPEYVGRRVGLTGQRYVVDLGVNAQGDPQVFEVDLDKDPLDERWQKYREDHDIPLERMVWAKLCLETKCAGNWDTFLEQYPPSADVAFLLGGRPFFDVKFPEVLGGEDTQGLTVYVPPQKFRAYAMGVDVGPGAPGGSWSALSIADATHDNAMDQVAAAGWELEPIAFAEKCYALAVQFNDAFVCIEANNVGVTVIEWFLRQGYSRLFVRQVVTKIKKRLVQRVGFQTGEGTRFMALSAFNDKLRKREYTLRDPRSKRAVNSFAYNAKGRPEHAKGKRDDFTFADAMVVQASAAMGRVRQEVIQKRRPTSVEEVLQWELANGRLYVGTNEIFADDFDDPVRRLLPGNPRSMSETLAGTILPR